jgi:hypothetical protein
MKAKKIDPRSDRLIGKLLWNPGAKTVYSVKFCNNGGVPFLGLPQIEDPAIFRV